MPDPFRDLDRVQYRLYEEPKRMAKSYRSFCRDVRRLCAKRSRRYFVTTFKGKRCRYPVLPINGPKWFIVEMYLPPNYHGNVESQPIQLLFQFDNLYLLGFYGDGKWQFFDDASTKGIDEGDIAKYITLLGFCGNYGTIGQTYTKFNIGFLGQVETYNSISTFPHCPKDQLKKALCRVVVTISEAIRFPLLMQMIVSAFEANELVKMLDSEEYMTRKKYKNISFHFNDWSSYCTMIRDRARFEARLGPNDGFEEAYESLLSFVGILLPPHR